MLEELEPLSSPALYALPLEPALFGFPWTSFSSHAQWSAVTWVPSLTIDHLDDESLNFLFYVPLGFLIWRQKKPVWSVIGWGAIFSAATELSQIFSNGRDPSMTDFSLNVLGAVAGYFARRRSNRALPDEG